MRHWPPPVYTYGPTTYIHQTTAGNVVFVAGGGYVGVGNITPAAQIHVYGAGTTNADYTNGDTVGQTLYLQSSSGGSGAGGQILFGSPGGVIAGIKSYLVSGSGPCGDLIFQTRSTSGNVLDRGRVDGTLGNWRFGSGTFPTARVHINAGSATASTAPLKFTSGTVNTTAEAGAVEYDGSSLHYTDDSTRRGTVPRALFTATADKTVANTTTQTTLFGTGVGSLTLPAGFFVAGRSVRVKLVGYVEDTGSPTMQVRLKLGSSTVADTGATTMTATGQRIFQCEGVLTCRTTGATGTVIGQIWWLSADALNDGYSVTTATTTINTTASLALDVTLEWGTADALNTCTITNSIAEVLN